MVPLEFRVRPPQRQGVETEDVGGGMRAAVAGQARAFRCRADDREPRPRVRRSLSMTWLQAVALGLVQGLTEVLPISSSAHLRLAAALAGWSDPGAAFTAVTQLGTEAAVWCSSAMTSSLSAGPGAVPLSDPRRSVTRTRGLAGSFSWGASQSPCWASRCRTPSKPASVPCVSRSGGTISGGLLLGYRREAAARYSFLLALPAVLASGMLELTRIGQATQSPWGPTLLATGVAFTVGYAAIGWMLRYISRHSFTGFVVYRLAIGSVLLGLLSCGVLSPTGS